MSEFNLKIKKCECGSNNIKPHHKITNNNFQLWLMCENCGVMSKFSHLTLLDAIRSWNKNNF